MKWQEIETAPKDGSKFLGGYTGGSGCWVYCIAIADLHRAYNIGRGLSPTHWMPLPEPPNES